ncbi:hypothetical protein Glove_43g93 [Diversispora epigaea]|uniref:Uncharacterized protein n=1 Tax=Diversispora epigaea TaxID=1348612 RepID=A0A397JI07_9GLOM|nr:hypothetical protein Glove_43g93 [Diversispora epigaea]
MDATHFLEPRPSTVTVKLFLNYFAIFGGNEPYDLTISPANMPTNFFLASSSVVIDATIYGLVSRLYNSNLTLNLIQSRLDVRLTQWMDGKFDEICRKNQTKMKFHLFLLFLTIVAVGALANPTKDNSDNKLEKRYYYGDVCWSSSYDTAPCYPKCGCQKCKKAGLKSILYITHNIYAKTLVICADNTDIEDLINGLCYDPTQVLYLAN